MSEPSVQTGLPDDERVLNLLNQAFDEWGSQDLFHWKYHRFPGFDPKEHCYYIEVDGELVGFRRIFHKELTIGSRSVPLYIHGDTAVKESHRGRGYYTKLREATTKYTDSKNGVVCSFNRVGSITYDAHIRQGWNFRALPLQMNILDYSNVIGQYAETIVESGTRVHALLSTIDSYITPRTTGGDPLALTEQTIQDPVDDRSIPILIPESVLDTCVEVASQRPLSNRALKGVSRPIKSLSSRRSTPADTGFQVQTCSRLNNDDLNEVQSLYDSTPTRFERNSEIIEHICQYPGAEFVLVRRRSRLVGFGILVPKVQQYTTEGRVLELVAVSEEAGHRVIRELELLGQQSQYDLLLMSSRLDVQNWIDIDKQVFMWEPESVMSNRRDELYKPEISLCDVL
ncbi:GNAT family N-acetyltransferase [Halorubrum gandharaense]